MIYVILLFASEQYNQHTVTISVESIITCDQIQFFVFI